MSFREFPGISGPMIDFHFFIKKILIGPFFVTENFRCRVGDVRGTTLACLVVLFCLLASFTPSAVCPVRGFC